MQQGEEQFKVLDKLGSRLSLEIECPVRWPGFDKNGLTCKHGLFFPRFRLEGDEDWSWTKREHEKWLK